MKREVPKETIDEQVRPSPLYPEQPSEQARVVASRPEFQKAILYRLRQAMYGNRGIPKVLISMLPVKLPAFEQYINIEVFTEEEAIEIDRFIRAHLQQINPSPEDVRDAIYETLESGKLRPAPDDQIDREEKWRRHLLAFATALQQVDLIRVAEIARNLSVVVKGADSEMVVDHLRNIVIPLLDSALRIMLMQEKKDFANFFSTIHIAELCTFIEPKHFSGIAGFALQDPEAKNVLGHEFLNSITSPWYDERLHEWETMGFSEGDIRALIRPAIPEYFIARQKIMGAAFMFSGELDVLLKRKLITEEECQETKRSHVVQGIVGSIGKKGDWVKLFIDSEKSSEQKGIFSPGELRANPAIRAAAQTYLEKSFVGGSDPAHLAKAIDEVVLAKIMTREEISALPTLLSMAALFLEKIFIENLFFDDPKHQEKIYIGTVQKYVEAGLGTRTYFDNVPAIKIAREEAEQKINQKDS